MATNTTNYDLIKPEYADAADIADINSNMDVIDGAMNDNATAISTANTTITAHSQSIAANTEAIATNAAAISSNSEAIAKINTNNNLGSFASKATLDGYLNTALSSLANDGVYAFRVNCTGSFDDFINGRVYAGMLYKYSNETNYAHVMLYSIVDTTIISGSKNSGTWYYGAVAKKSEFTTITEKQIIRVSGTSYFTERSGFISRKIGNSIACLGYFNITTQIPEATTFANLQQGTANIFGTVGLVNLDDKNVYVCSIDGGNLQSRAVIPTGYYYIVGTLICLI